MVTVVYDNNSFDPRLKTGWGFSCLVEGLEKIILFDTGGDGRVLLSNMKKLGSDPADIDVVVLSHAHGDHTGGLVSLLERNRHVSVYLSASLLGGFKGRIERYEVEVTEVGGATKICADASSTGELGTSIKEQALLIEGGLGLTVITGCAHPGILHILTEAKEMSNLQLDLALDGWHLRGVSRQKVEAVTKEFRNLGVRRVAPCHCSGDTAREMFEISYREDFIRVGVGKTVQL